MRYPPQLGSGLLHEHEHVYPIRQVGLRERTVMASAPNRSTTRDENDGLFYHRKRREPHNQHTAKQHAASTQLSYSGGNFQGQNSGVYLTCPAETVYDAINLADCFAQTSA